MKMIMVVYSAAADYDVFEQLKKLGICGYTKLKNACGEGTETEPKLNTHTWPGDNNVLFMAVNDEEVSSILAELANLKKLHTRAGIRGFVMPVTEVI
jgi:nitrogen regulatory protein PII